MASSLEDLLAKEGFKGSRRVTKARSSFHHGASSEPLHSLEDRLCVSGDRIKTHRTKSNDSLHQFRSRLSISDTHSAQNQRSRDNDFTGDKNDEPLKNGTEKKSYRDSNSGKRIEKKSPEEEDKPRYVVSGKEDGRFDDVYSNRVSNTKRGNEEYFNELVEKEKVGKVHSRSSSIHMHRLSSATRTQDSNTRSNSKGFEDRRIKNGHLAMKADSNLPLDEVAVQAVVSILNGYINSFQKDEDFRTTLRHNCFSSLNFIELGEENNSETKVIRSLEQAIETIEKSAEEPISATYLKRATMQLSIITGLSLNDLKYECTCGIPNYKLSACAHLYLSVVYMIQRKNKVSAKHLLQVFCDSPLQARTILLSELWEHLFSPQFSHLKSWYNKEAGVLLDTPSKTRKLRLLQKVYNEHLDSGTHTFAVYYKDWLTEGVESPTIPSICIPSISSSGSQQGSSLGHSSESSSSTEPFSPQPMVSKKLYESVFASSSRQEACEVGDNQDEDSLENCVIGSYGSTVVKQTLIYESETVGFTDQETEYFTQSGAPTDGSHPLNEESSTSEGSYFPSIPQEFICPLTGNIFEEPVTLETGQTFEREAMKAWFENGNRTCPVTRNILECIAMPFTNLILKRLIDDWKSERFNLLLDFASQTVEISEKLRLKKKDEAAVYKLEGLLSSLKEEDKSTYAKHLISIGVLTLLFRRFELGNMEEKSHVVALLLNFIHADSSCIYQIARRLNRKCLLELLRSKVTLITDAILLLTELVSMKRRKDVTSFISGLAGEDVFNTIHVLLTYLENPSLLEKPLIAVLLLHFGLLVEPERFSIYREVAVNAIVEALDASLNDEKARKKCCRALLILCGHFSSEGKTTTKTSILKLAGYNNDNSELKPPRHEEEGQQSYVTISSEDEEERGEELLMNLLESLIGDGESPFLKTISRCLDSRHLDLVRTCLITITWLSSSLSTLFNAGLHLRAFLSISSQLKRILENGEIELKILASMSLLNFSKISECRMLLKTMAEDIAPLLYGLIDVTWTAKQLHAIVSRENL